MIPAQRPFAIGSLRWVDCDAVQTCGSRGKLRGSLLPSQLPQRQLIDANAAHAPTLDSTHMRIPHVAMCCQSNVAWATTAAHDGDVPQKQSPVSTFTFRSKEKVLTNDSRQQFCKVNELKSSDTAYIEPGYDIYIRIVHMQR